MKKQIKSILILTLVSILSMQYSSCSKSATATTPTPTPTPNVGKFTCMLGTESFSAPDAYLLNGAGGTLGVIAKDSKGRTFQLSIFENQFPVNTAKDVAWATAIAYTDENQKTYVTKLGTMTITSYGKTSGGVTNNMKGNFSITVTSNGQDIVVTEGVFDVSTK